MSLTEAPLASEAASAAAMAGMALVSVGLWTLRVTLAARGRKLFGAATAAAEAVVFAVVFSNLTTSLDAPASVLGYAIGVAAGTLLGLVIDERTSRGASEIRVVLHGRDSRAVDGLRRLGWPIVSFTADAGDGRVTVASIAVDDADVDGVLATLRRDAPRAAWTVHQLRRMSPPSLVPLTPFQPQEEDHDHDEQRRPSQHRAA
jgi:uncharacterized protein YebE (UPF0316 family)